MTNILAKLNTEIMKAKASPHPPHAWRYTITMEDAEGIMTRLKSVIKSRDSYRTDNYKLQKHAGRLKQEVDQKAGEIRELKEQLEVAQASELLKIANENLERLEKFEAPNPKCNAGHVNSLPLHLWNCPMCTDHHSKENVELKLEVERLMGLTRELQERMKP